jgi:ribosomal protein S18 acetylase RimI-like enzyme
VTTLIEKAIATNAASLALGNERYPLCGATFVRNTTAYDIYDANHVHGSRPRSRREVEELLEAAEREYAHAKHRRFDVDYRTPPEFVARLVLEGYQREDALILVLERDLPATASRHDIRPVEMPEDWEAYRQLMLADWRESRQKRGRPAEEDVAQRMFETKPRKQPPVQNFMAYADGKPVAYFNSWAGIDGVGQVEDLFTLPQFRHRGIASALIRHCVEDSRAKGAGSVIIVADPGDTPKRMYATLGFQPVAIVSHYLKRIEP